jgi:hypothetical protein
MNSLHVQHRARLRNGDQASPSGDLRSNLMWEIAAIAPTRAINRYIFIAFPYHGLWLFLGAATRAGRIFMQ